jgi:redox-sensitive bicupin YhaK (pirin superfamily)
MKTEVLNTILHKAATRGHVRHSWLDTHHTFSFASYFDPERIHFGTLRVLNDDLISGGGGFDRHPHDNMEIVTIVLSGELEHRDSMGHTMLIRPGEVQVMSAGKGLFHSEHNGSQDMPLELLQIWIFPDTRNITPRYDQKAFDPAARRNRWQTLVSPDDEDALRIRQQARISRIELDAGFPATYTLSDANHGAYVFMIDGKADVAGFELERRDGIGISDVVSFTVNPEAWSDLLVIEIPMK